jgi:hypothetical protein
MPDLQRWMAQASLTAFENLHPAQQALTFGSTWVRFVDVRNKIIEFGIVTSLAAIDRASEESESMNMEEKREARAEIINGIEVGYLYGWAYSRLEPRGVLGVTHKSYVWPIEEHVLHAARAARWQYDNMSLAARINLEAARRGQLQHMRSRRV